MEFLAALVVAAIVAAVYPNCTPDKPADAGVAAEPSPETQDQVILLPETDGTVGRIVVKASSNEKELSKAYSGAAVGTAGKITAVSTTQKAVDERYGQLLEARPPPPRSFLLYFEAGSSELTPDSIAELEAMEADVKSRPAPELLVVGHTDRAGSNAYNDALSMRRADTIAKDLQSLGVQPLKLEATGRGERDPLIPTADGVAEPRNRRVEVSVR